MDPEAQWEALKDLLPWVFAIALSLAALLAIVAILEGRFAAGDWRIIGTSLGFGVFSAIAAAGAALRPRSSESLRLLGGVTIAVSAAAFVLLLVAVWGDDLSDDTRWRWFGCFALAALATAHASLVAGARRDTDGIAVSLLATVSIGFGMVEAALGIVVLSELVQDLEQDDAKVGAVLVILLLLTSVLPPILRRAQRPPPATPERSPSADLLAGEVLAIADQIESLNADPGNRTPQIRRECERLRELARSQGG